MPVRLITTSDELKKYDQWIAAHPQGNLWQSLERKQYIESVGKDVRIYVVEEEGRIVASALVMIDRTSFGLSTWEIPRGPLVKWKMENGKLEALMNQIIADAKKDRCMTLYLSPIKSLSTFHFPLSTSARSVHCAATRIIDLTQSEDEILKQMKPKGRYNIRVADKHGVRVEASDDVDAFYALVQSTARRDGFTSQPKEKYKKFLEKLPGSFLLLAYAMAPSPQPSPDGRGKGEGPIAALLGVTWNKTAIYYYGASSYEHRALMAPYALQLAAIRRCKAAECAQYDLLGIAPPDAPPEHPWQGITRFKERFGGTLVEYPPEQQLVLRPVMKSILDLKRRFF